jgi:hypothetical protein
MTPVPDLPHGYEDDERSRLLRRRPPARALGWVARVLGSPVERVRWLRGGSTSAVHALWLADGSRAVLRRYVRPEVVGEAPDIVARERTALGLVAASPVPTPSVLAADETGTEADVPALLLSRLPGRLDWDPSSLDPWLRRLAGPPTALAATPLPPEHGLPPFRPYRPASWEVPARMHDASLWERAVDLFHGPPLDPDRVLLQRDYHPGNVLWTRGRITGVVDWQAACTGPPSVDPCWCRVNLIGRFGLEVADRFVDIWQEVSGRTYHPWAEAVLLVDVLAWPHRHQRQVDDYERSLARRLAELGT